MTDKTIADVLDKSIDKLSVVAEAIRKAAPDFWAASVRAHRLEGVVQVVAWAAVAIASGALLHRGARMMRSDKYDDLAPVLFIIGGVLGLVALIAAFAAGDTALNKCLNPEWFASWDIINAVKP